MKLHDKLGAMQQLAKLHGLVIDKVELTRAFDDMPDAELDVFIANGGKVS